MVHEFNLISSIDRFAADKLRYEEYEISGLMIRLSVDSCN